MVQVNNQNLSVSLEVVFSTPISFSPAKLSAVASALIEQFTGYGLKPSAISQNIGDQLFNYELAFSLFNNQGQFRLTGERLFANIQNARTDTDVKTLIDALVRVQKCLPPDTACRTNFQAVAHAAFANENDYSKFFAPFIDSSADIVDGGRLVFIKEASWPSKVRLSIERSIMFQNSVFITWWAEEAGMVDLEKIKEIADKFGKSLQKVGLEINFAQA